MQDEEEVSITELATVSGGMRWEQFRPSTNVEDRRGGGCVGACGPRRSKRQPDLSRSQLARDAGIDDIGQH